MESSQPSGEFLSCKQRLSARVSKKHSYMWLCARVLQLLYCSTLISCVTDPFLHHSTAATSTMHRAAPVVTAVNPRAQGAAAFTAAPVGRERLQVTLSQRGTGMPQAQSFCGKDLEQPLPQPGCVGLAHLPRPSLATSHLSSSWRKITGPLLETWEAPS